MSERVWVAGAAKDGMGCSELEHHPILLSCLVWSRTEHRNPKCITMSTSNNPARNEAGRPSPKYGGKSAPIRQSEQQLSYSFVALCQLVASVAPTATSCFHVHRVRNEAPSAPSSGSTPVSCSCSSHQQPSVHFARSPAFFLFLPRSFSIFRQRLSLYPGLEQ